MEEPLTSREEVTALLIALSDVMVETRRIRRLLEDGEEEEDLEE